MFEKAARKNYKFPSTKGELNVIQLWTLGLTDLDQVYKNLYSQKVQTTEGTLLDTKDRTAKELETKIEIVKHIATTKQTEAKAASARAAAKVQMEHLLAAKARKEEGKIENMSGEELDALIAGQKALLDGGEE